MSKVKIYHNPKCSKSRETLDLIRGNGIEPEVIEYLKQPLTKSELKEILTMLKLPVKDMVRTKEALFKEIAPNLENESETLGVLAKHPKLMERPIVVKGKKAIIGRPPEAVLSLF